MTASKKINVATTLTGCALARSLIVSNTADIFAKIFADGGPTILFAFGG